MSHIWKHLKGILSMLSLSLGLVLMAGIWRKWNSCAPNAPYNPTCAGMLMSLLIAVPAFVIGAPGMRDWWRS